MGTIRIAVESGVLRKLSYLLVIFAMLSSGVVGADEAAQSSNARPPASGEDLQRWLKNMIWYHRFTTEEVVAATGLADDAIQNALEFYQIDAATKPRRAEGAPLLVLPYPGGRHPRIGFLDGAVRPQRETKVSVFTPWDDSSYVVLDIPEAIWSNLGLTYLAHTHIPTIFDKQEIKLPRLEWKIDKSGSFRCERELPNGIKFGTYIRPYSDHLEMEMWLVNGTGETLSDLRVQNCAMLKGAKEFAAPTNDNKVFWDAYAAVKSAVADRWLIMAWEPIHRPWGNPLCPCMHADPKFPDCEPGKSQHLRGWCSFYLGSNVQAEFRRIEQTGWKEKPYMAP